jgi:serine/threonine protein kinase
LIGRTLAHYRVTAALGAGGRGEVYRATDTKLGRDVALKVLPAEMAASPERLERFRREAKALVALGRPAEAVPLLERATTPTHRGGVLHGVLGWAQAVAGRVDAMHADPRWGAFVAKLRPGPA